jgi:carboxyvinyl-carboxyphosphonate phosphorylmutase
MRHTEQRWKLRELLAGTRCLSPASVFDALSARVAESVGYEIAMMAGSSSSNTTLAAPDLMLITLTEFADQVRRIMRVCNLPLLVDADHGYGNALNVMRTVQELEHAGVSALSIEDTALPHVFGQTAPELLSSIDEGVGKMRAALAARQDPSLVIAGRTSALRIEGVASAVARVKAYEAAGVDAIFVVGQKNLAEMDAISAAIKLPIIVGNGPELDCDAMAARGVRVMLQGHQSVAAVVKALQDCYSHLHNGGSPADLRERIASDEEMARITECATYRKWERDFLR